jgi:hypothetical protein
MNNKILNEIKEFAVSKLNSAYGYCGVAESDTFLMINSDDENGNDIVIKITLKEE